MRAAIWVAAMALCAGCGGGGDGDADGDVDGDGDLDGGGDGDADGDDDGDGDEDGGGEGCEDLLLLEEDFEVVPDLPDTQIHPTAVFDGETIWVGFTLVEEGDTGLFDTWLVGIGCDGRERSAPRRVNTFVAPNDIDPVLALDGDRLLVLWTSDTGEFPDNMQTRYRVLGLDGTEVMAEDARLQTSRGGELVTGNAFHPSATALSGGGFAVAGARGLAGLTVLQVYLQLLDREGGLDGEAVDGFFEEDVGQAETAVSRLGAGGDLALAWTSFPQDEGEVVWKRADDGAAEPESLAPEAAESRTPSLAADPADPGHTFLAFAVDQGSGVAIRVVDVGVDGPDRPAVELGERTRIDHAPVVTVGPGGPVVGWFRNLGGLSNEVVIQALDLEGEDLVPAGERVLVPYESAPSLYGLGLVPVTADVALVVWAEGASPAFRLYGRFVSLR